MLQKEHDDLNADLRDFRLGKRIAADCQHSECALEDWHEQCSSQRENVVPEMDVVDFLIGPLGLSMCQFLGIRDLTNLCFVSKRTRGLVATFLRMGSVGHLDRGGFDTSAIDLTSVWSEDMTQQVGRLFGAVTTGMHTEELYTFWSKFISNNSVFFAPEIIAAHLSEYASRPRILRIESVLVRLWKSLEYRRMGAIVPRDWIYRGYKIPGAIDFFLRCFKWRIPDFGRRVQDCMEHEITLYLHSFAFKAGGRPWRIRVYVRYDRAMKQDMRPAYISLFLEDLTFQEQSLQRATDEQHSKSPGKEPAEIAKTYFSFAVGRNSLEKCLRNSADNKRACMVDYGKRPFHLLTTCDECQSYPICGSRYKGIKCSDYDLCGDCYRERVKLGYAEEDDFIEVVNPTSHVIAAEHSFCSNRSTWGFPYFMSIQDLDEFLNPDGSLLIQAHVHVAPERQNTEMQMLELQPTPPVDLQ